MTIIRILQYPDANLKRIAKPVTDFGEATQKIIDAMLETYHHQTSCAALAATQLDIPNAPRITVIGPCENNDGMLVLVNGEILERNGTYTEEEGCMSVGNDLDVRIYEKVTRAATVRVKAQDRNGKPLDFVADGFLAKCIQHEFDHLDGVIYLQRISNAKRARIIKKLRRTKTS